jgi:hypothetical protein
MLKIVEVKVNGVELSSVARPYFFVSSTWEIPRGKPEKKG